MIAPRIDYKAVIWHKLKADESAADLAYIKKLTTVQQLTMKAILGCYRTTPIVAMENESDLTPT